VTDPAGSPSFETTRWSVVLAAGHGDPAKSRDALETLCRAYWYPLYAFARRRGADRHRAEDLVQGFFAALLEKGWVEDADPSRGRFRAFLATAFARFDAKEHERDAAAKRGGGRVVLGLDFEGGESQFSREPSDMLTPERAFERRWALTLLSRALARTEAEFADAPRADLFAALLPFIGGRGDARPYAEIAARLGMTDGAVKVAVHRLRARHREHLRAEIRDTVPDDASVDDEIAHLVAAVSDG
jgi:RNA polymerase sigma factor (sigma-70 family)